METDPITSVTYAKGGTVSCWNSLPEVLLTDPLIVGYQTQGGKQFQRLNGTWEEQP